MIVNIYYTEMALKLRQHTTTKSYGKIGYDQPAMVLLNIPTKDPKRFAYSTSYGCWLFHKNIDDVWDELHDTHFNDTVAIEDSSPEREGYAIEIPCEWGELLTSITDMYNPLSMSCDVTKITIADEYVSNPIGIEWIDQEDLCVVIVPKVFTYDEAVTAFRDSVRAIFP